MSTTANRIIKNTGFLYIKMAITIVISLYSTRLILESLGASDFGIYNLVGSSIGMLGFLNASMAGSTQRFLSISLGEGNFEKQNKIFNISLILHMLIAAFLSLLLLILGYIFFENILQIPSERLFASKIIFISLIISCIFSVLSSPYEAIMNAHENMKYYALIGILESILKLFIALYITWTNNDKLIVYGILMSIVPIITISILKNYCSKYYKECRINLIGNWDKQIAKKMFNYAGWSFIDASSAILTTNGLSIVLNHFYGTLLNAAQGIAGQVGGQLMQFSQNMIKALNPVIMKSEGAGNRDFMIKTAVIGCKYSYLLLAFFALPFILESSFVLKIWLKEVPSWAVLFCALQLTKSLFEQIAINLWAAISAQGKIKHFYICKSISNISPLLLTIIAFLNEAQPYWLYINWIICWGILTDVIIIYYAKKLCKISIMYYLKITVIPCFFITISVLSIGFIPQIFYTESLIRCFITIILSILSFLISFLIFNTKEEMNIISSKILNIHKKWKY